MQRDIGLFLNYKVSMKYYLKRALSVILLLTLFMGIIYLDYKLTGKILLDSFSAIGLMGFVICLGIELFTGNSNSRKS